MAWARVAWRLRIGEEYGADIADRGDREYPQYTCVVLDFLHAIFPHMLQRSARVAERALVAGTALHHRNASLPQLECASGALCTWQVGVHVFSGGRIAPSDRRGLPTPSSFPSTRPN